MTELTRTAWGMAEAAEDEIETVDVERLAAELGREDVVVLDIRDIREVWLEGSIPGVKHAPRGMLEFWADPETEYYKDYFDPDKRYICYCNEGGRSALAAKRLGEMGYSDVAHLGGGFTAWQEAGRDVVDVPQKDYKN
ncbi:rhodanese domain-containing protein [Halogeometricum pallidum JCM 14848]|uniref:Rhodanese domain-containing protein n=1 Tax=Halogeometricum pallidum JCM 14848 TaxID=1227487 RepID=M0D671_HALPD|nr:rhodanese-like domain-containing protein [Halogeometricum pallidum]ELZ30986.1 rhodanese domain-containing protein [Halogeometricum pallidum JCM 14848]